MKKKIFVVDDEKDIRDILSVNIVKQNYEVTAFASAEKALEGMKKTTPDLIILDIMMEGMDGFEFCKTIRQSGSHKNIPIIFLSARTEEFDRVLGLELGADDYVSKPFSVKELMSRIKAVLRRSEGERAAAESEKFAYKGIEINPGRYSVSVDGKAVRVTKTEFEILQLFIRYPEKIFSRDNIIDSIRGDDVYITDRTVDVHIMNLRKKLGKYKDIIYTFPGVGYGIKE
jgi:two-component system, OmpR family, alkaline phosphatase synthesis response regulator PhoP